MDDFEKDRYGVSWGQEKGGPNSTKGYLSFHLEGMTYNLNDIVYLLASDGPPYIAKIVTMYEKVETKEKCMLVRWFCRPCELPVRTAGVNWKEDCKEIFMMWGDGSKGVVNPASTIGKCTVVCSTLLEWNSPPPTEEVKAGADHTFSYAFDTNGLHLVSLNCVVKKFGEGYVTGIRVQSLEVKKRSGGNPMQAVQPGIAPAARVVDSDRRGAQPIRRASDGLLLVSKGNGGHLRKAVEPGINPGASVIDTDRRGPQLVGRASNSPSVGNVRKGTEMSDLIAAAKKKKRFSSGPKSESGSLERAKVSGSSLNGPSESQRIVSSVYKSNATPRVGGSELDGKRMQDPRGSPTPPVFSIYNSNVTPKVAGVELVKNDLKGKQIQDSKGAPSLPVVQNFFNLPWHKALERALEKDSALLLQNLDPWFSSSEIESMLIELLRFSCDAHMLPPKDFSSYTSGAALVLFQNQSEAEKAYAKFTENVLIWSEDQRPVVASRASKQRYEINHFHGFLDFSKFSATAATFSQGRGGATSQCTQPNTVVFEMGMQWRLLQERHSEAWNIVAKQCKISTNHMAQIEFSNS